MKIGRRLAIKILNASASSRCGLGADEDPSAVTDPLDQALLAALAGVVRRGHRGLRRLRLHPGARGHRDVLLDVLRRLPRAGQGPGVRRPRRRGRARPRRPPSRLALSMQLRLFAPFLPFVTEEVWSWWQEGSVHRAAWPDADELAALAAAATPACSPHVGRARRRCARPSPRRRCRCAPRSPSATVTGPAEALDRVRRAAEDLPATGRVGELAFAPADDPLGATVTL